jgi:signal transduction histidine kinase
MIKSLRGKITVLYMFLILAIAAIGVSSILNLYSLSKSIDGLMVDNYKSINASTNMLRYLNAQHMAISEYLYIDAKDGIDRFHENNILFLKSFNIANNNITEDKEGPELQKLSNNYALYIKKFSKLQEIKNNSAIEQSNNYYKNELIPIYEDIKVNLYEINEINESAMFKSKESVTKKAIDSMNRISIISILGVVGALLISSIVIKRALNPIYELIETVKDIKQGNLDKQAPILSKDEVGELAREFNNMTRRLYEFEQSTLGRLLEENNKSFAIVKSILDPLIVLDSDYKIQLINDTCEKYLNIKEENSAGNHLLQAVKNNDIYEYVWNLANGKNVNKKTISLYIDDKTYYFNIIATIIKDTQGQVSNIVILLRNVTSLIEIEAVKTDFIYSISHELKTPLTSIVMGADLISNENIGHLNDKQKRIINTIKEDGEKLSHLVSNLLKVSHIESEDNILNIEKCNIIDILNESLSNLSQSISYKKININSYIEKNMPNIYIDKERTTWVLNNLISNAIKYSDYGREIIIRIYNKKGRIYIEVEDSGKGIPKEYINKIFDKFVQIKNDDGIEGSGLGLYICKNIIESHNGSIWCESELGKGSKFIFYIPVKI